MSAEDTALVARLMALAESVEFPEEYDLLCAAAARLETLVREREESEGRTP